MPPLYRSVSVALCMTVAGACGVSLDVPEDVTVTCARDADCQAGQSCSALGECVVSRDGIAPQALSATAVTATTVIVAVSEPLASPGANAISIVTALPGETLAVADVATSADGLTLALTTVAQRPGVEYTAVLSALTDTQGNPMDAEHARVVFRGFGGAPDTSPPQLLLPRPNGRVIVGAEHAPIALVWTARASASAYTVEVATTSSFTNIVASLVTDRETVSAAFAATGPFTYYWRVRADITDAGSYGTGRFSVVEDALHVYCAPGADCSQGAAVELGDRDFPFRSIARAITSAQADGIRVIDVASRDTEAYGDVVAPSSGMTLRGGYGAEFDASARDVAGHPTRVRVPGTALVIGAVTEPVVLEGLHFISQVVAELPLEAQQNTVGSIDGAAAMITMSHCIIESEPGPGAATGLDVSTAGTGRLHLTDASRIQIGAPINQAFGLRLNANAAADVDGDVVIAVATPTTTSPNAVGVGIRTQVTTELIVRHATVSAGGRAGSAALYVIGGTATVEDSVFRVNPGEHGPAVTQAGVSTLVFTHNRVLLPAYAGGGFGVLLLAPSSGMSALLADNVIAMDGTAGDSNIGVFLSGPQPQVTLVHNTVVVGGDTSTAVQVSGSPVVTNNLLVCAGGGTGVNEAPSGSQPITDPASFQHNTIVGCATAYRNESNAALLTTAEAIDDLDGGAIAGASCSGCQHSRYSDTVVSLTTPGGFFTAGVGPDGRVDVEASFVPAVADAGNGKSTSGNDCGSVETPVSCGAITDDLRHAARATPPTRGALEMP